MSTHLSRTRPTFTEDLYLEPLYTARTLQQLETRAIAAYSDTTYETENVLGLTRAIRAAVIVRRAELEVISALRNNALAALVRHAHAISSYHVLPHHEGGYQVERDGVSLIRCTSRQEAIAHRDVLASGRAVA
jgi:hypothetical protein